MGISRLVLTGPVGRNARKHYTTTQTVSRPTDCTVLWLWAHFHTTHNWGDGQLQKICRLPNNRLRIHQAKEADRYASGTGWRIIVRKKNQMDRPVVLSHFYKWTYCSLLAAYLQVCHNNGCHSHSAGLITCRLYKQAASGLAVFAELLTVSGKLTGWLWTLVYDAFRLIIPTALLLH